MQEAVENETLFKWAQSLKLAVLKYVKSSKDPRADWIRVKFELKRIELLSRDPVRFFLFDHSGLGIDSDLIR